MSSLSQFRNPFLSGFALGTWAVQTFSTPNVGQPPTSSGPYRPPNWALPQQVSLTTTLPSQSATVSTSGSVAGAVTPGSVISTSQATPSVTTIYFFDAVTRIDHNEEVAITDHPVQNGASLTDHAYAIPIRIILEVGISDSMASYQAGQYSGGRSKSATAYQQFKQIKDLRLPCTLQTRLGQYTNMLIEQIVSYESSETTASWKATIRLRQIIMATVAVATVSGRPNQTTQTPEGTLSPQPVPPSLGTFMDNMTLQPSWNSNPTQPN